jgi:hypothetical protein
MKLIRDVIKDEDKYVVEVGDEIIYFQETYKVKEIVKQPTTRYILVENQKGEVYILDDKSLQSIIN